MTFLELCQHVHRLIRPGPELPGSVPSSTTGQTGLLGEIVYWTAKAWTDIQSEETKWSWMTVQGSISLTSSTRTYAFSTSSTSTIPAMAGTATDVYADRVLPMCSRSWQQPHGLVYLTATGVSDTQPCWFVPYQDWRGVMDRGTRSDGKPRHFTELPGRQLQFDPTPDATYTFLCDFRVMPQSMLTDTTTAPLNWPTTSRGLPAHYHDVIAWRAVKMYALTRQEASNLYQQADREERRYLEKMRREFLPSFDFEETEFSFA